MLVGMSDHLLEPNKDLVLNIFPLLSPLWGRANAPSPLVGEGASLSPTIHNAFWVVIMDQILRFRSLRSVRVEIG
jgi:hypothetical protein